MSRSDIVLQEQRLQYRFLEVGTSGDRSGVGRMLSFCAAQVSTDARRTGRFNMGRVGAT